MLDFADRVQNDSKPSKDAFSHIFDTIQDYHDIIDKYELKNKSIFYDCSNLFHIFAATKYILLPCK